MKRSIILCLCVMLVPALSAAHGSEFRSISPIVQPDNGAWESEINRLRQDSPDLETFARQARTRVPELARQGIQRIFDAWNNGRISEYLDAGMVNRDRFLDAMDGSVPRDARVRIMAIESVQPLDDSTKLEQGTLLRLLVNTRVSVRVKTQIEYNDAKTGFQRIEGVNEFILRLQQLIPLKPEGGR